MLYLIVSHRWHDLATAAPAHASSNPMWNLATGIEIGVSTTLSWWPYVGAMVRMAPNGRTAAVPTMLGLGVSVALLCLIGLAGILVLKTSDPAGWLRMIGGPVYSVVALLFVTAANLGTSITGTYCSAIGLRNYKPFERMKWPLLVMLTTAPVALIGVFFPGLVSNHFGTFVAFIGVMFAPLCGIQIVDYFVLRRGRISIRAIYDTSADGAYRYWRGVNPAAIAGMSAGCCTYIYLFDPISYASRFPYQYTSASLPTLVVGGFVYWLVTVAFVRRAGYGGYAR
jgi:NCS1 family nucleobase:cation symporter-1